MPSSWIKLFLFAWLSNQSHAIVTTTSTSTDIKAKSPMFEFLKFDKNPSFNVLEKTKEYVEKITLNDPDFENKYYHPDYLLRGPVVGPINRKDLALSQKGLGVQQAFPGIRIDTFGYTIDPENPYRCIYFQRWRAVHEQDLQLFGTVYPATQKECETPLTVFSVVWTPDQKIIYEQVGAVVDRLEGNTQGKAAVFGLLHTAGVQLSASPGDKVFAFIQRMGHLAGGMGRSWSKKKDIPTWWISKSRGADGTDQW
jgi:hypothetical protein